MKMRSFSAAATLLSVFLLGAAIEAGAAEIRVLVAYGAREVMLEIAPRFEAATGHNLAIKLQTPRVIQKTIQGGETADVVIAAGVDLAKGQILPGSVTPIARSVLGVAVHKDAPKPDISSADAVKRVLLAAKSVSYDDGAAAAHFVKVLDRWGIADEMKRKTIIGAPPPRRVGDLVANGEVEIGVHVISLMMGIPGIEIAPLPEELQQPSVTSAAIMRGAKDTTAARALIDFLRTPEAVAVIKAKGMVPAAP